MNNFICPMHPEIISDKPGICPKCGMRLVETEEKTDDDNMNYDEHDK